MTALIYTAYTVKLRPVKLFKIHDPSKAPKRKLKSFFLSTYSHSLSHKKELDVYHRVPGSSDQKTDFGRFGEHPTHRL